LGVQFAPCRANNATGRSRHCERNSVATNARKLGTTRDKCGLSAQTGNFITPARKRILTLKQPDCELGELETPKRKKRSSDETERATPKKFVNKPSSGANKIANTCKNAHYFFIKKHAN